MAKIEVPFTQEQIDYLNLWQNGPVHPFTCSGHNIPECTRASGESEGILIATSDGWICPCGKYTQNWAHDFMGDGSALKIFHDGLDKLKARRDSNPR